MTRTEMSAVSEKRSVCPRSRYQAEKVMRATTRTAGMK